MERWESGKKVLNNHPPVHLVLLLQPFLHASFSFLFEQKNVGNIHWIFVVVWVPATRSALLLIEKFRLQSEAIEMIFFPMFDVHSKRCHSPSFATVVFCCHISLHSTLASLCVRYISTSSYVCCVFHHFVGFILRPHWTWFENERDVGSSQEHTYHFVSYIRVTVIIVVLVSHFQHSSMSREVE